MKNLIAAGALSLVATGAVAQEYATITYVEPRYVTETISRPYQSCYMVDVPIYGNVGGGGATGGDVLGGAIIGGLIGKGASGNDKGAAVGAILGGMIAAENKNNGQRAIVGYQQQQQCETRYDTENVTKIKDYKIRFEWNGYGGSAYTYNNYSVGDRLPVEVSIRAK